MSSNDLKVKSAVIAGNQIFQTIRENGPILRSELATLTGMSRSTVSLHVEKLLQTQLVKEEEISKNGDKRKKSLLKLAENAGFVIGIEIKITGISIGLFNLNVELLDFYTEQVSVGKGPGFIINLVFETIDKLLVKNKISSKSIMGVGMGIPGTIEKNSRIIVGPKFMPGWNKYPLRKTLEQRFNCRIILENEVNAMAVGSHFVGTGKEVDNLLFVKIGTGIGAGIFVNGELYRGSSGSAGDIGHISIDDLDIPCHCGNYGCLEMIGSGAAIAKRGEEVMKKGGSEFLTKIYEKENKITVEDISLGADHGDSLCLEIIKDASKAVGKVLAKVAGFFNPSLIIIGGGVAEAGEKFLSGIREMVFMRSYPIITSELQIKKSSLGRKACVLGVATTVVNEILSENSITDLLHDLSQK